MKKYLFYFTLLVGVVGFQSCNSDWFGNYNPDDPDEESPINIEISPCDEGEEITIDSIPQSILDYINTNFEGLEIESAEVFDNNGEIAIGIELSDGTSILFDETGLVITSANEEEEQEISVDSLLQGIIDYVNNNFQGASIESAEFEVEYGAIYLELELDDGSAVIFDLEGNFLCEDNDEEDDHEDDDDEDEEVDLPDVIIDFIANNYPNYSIEEAELETLCDSTEVYEVEIEQETADDDEELELFFDLDGNFLFEIQEISFNDLPAIVIDAINSNYPNANIDTDEAYVLLFADGSMQYEVELENNDEELELIIDAEGVIICIEED